MAEQLLHQTRVARLLRQPDTESMPQTFGTRVIALDACRLHHRPDMSSGLGSTPRPQFVFPTALRLLLLSDAVHQLQCVQVMIGQRHGSVSGLIALFQDTQPQRLSGQVHVLEGEFQSFGDSAA